MAVAATLPALADGPAPAEQEAVTQVVEQEPEAILGEPVEDEVVDGALDQSATDYEGVIGEPLEDEITADEWGIPRFATERHFR